MVGGRRPPEVIQRVVHLNEGRMRACYNAALGRDPTLAGRVTTTFVIRPDGTVRGASANAEIADPQIGPCFAAAFAALTFGPTEGASVRVVYPMMLSSE